MRATVVGLVLLALATALACVPSCVEPDCEEVAARCADEWLGCEHADGGTCTESYCDCLSDGGCEGGCAWQESCEE